MNSLDSDSDTTHQDLTVIEIKLPADRWTYDPQKLLGERGGFASVFEGWSTTGVPVAVKRFRFDRGHFAHREIHIAELMKPDLRFVVPVLDAGRNEETNETFIVMPRASGNLKEFLRTSTKLSPAAAVDILLAIISGLEEVPQIVHRDLKPANILLLDGTWRIADFGIARYIEESTSDQTLQDFHSGPYAAPEQWKGEDPSRATDIYALGCIAYELLTGTPPHAGPGRPDFRRQHLEDAPRRFEGCSNALWTAIHLALEKVPAARPALPRLRQLFATASDNQTAMKSVAPGIQALRQLGQQAQNQRANREAQEAARMREAARRDAIAAAGVDSLRSLTETLFDTIKDALGDVDTQKTASGSRRQSLIESIARLKFGPMTLEIALQSGNAALPADAFSQTPVDAIGQASIRVIQSGASTSYEWGASLWFADFTRSGLSDGMR